MVRDKDWIKTILPQREPFLFIDEVIEIDGTDRILAVKYIDPKESFFIGHFPGKPIMPGVLIVEAMAQASIVLYSLCYPDIASRHPDYYIGNVKAEFLAPVFPNDKLIIEIIKVKIFTESGIVRACARVGEKVAAKADLIFGVKKYA